MAVRFAFTIAIIVAAGTAVAADQTILGNSFVAKNPGDVVKRKVIGKGKEVASPNTLIGDPTVTGGFLTARTFAATGGTPSEQTLPLPQGTSASTGKPFWSGDAAKGFKYKDPRGENGPVKLAQLKRSGSGVFTVKAVLVGKNGTIDVLPPNPGNGACFLVGINGGDAYDVDFRHNPQITNDGAVLFKATKPHLEGTCLDPTTTSTTTIATTTTTSTTGTTLIFAPCGTGPTCGGSCAPSEACLMTFDATSGSAQFPCQCIPPGVTQCSYSGYPTCGGVCSGGGVCQPLKDVQVGAAACGCVDPNQICDSCNLGLCASGSACVLDQPAFPPVCDSGCGAP
jgi:hypothetical protein